MNVKFAHVNLIARDWKRLASFYQTVFNCRPLPPERNLSGKWLDEATTLKDARIRGIHLQLPGFENGGVTLEIFEYEPAASSAKVDVNTPGFSHVAFRVDDVQSKAEEIKNAGGRALGKLTKTVVPGAGSLVFQYLYDPEGNIIEIQKWVMGP